MRFFNFKNIALGLVTLLASAAAGYAVNITGTNSQNENSIVRVGYVRLSVTDNITAFAGGGQASATLLDSAYNRVTTVATAADSVRLPACQIGAQAPGLSNTIGIVVWVTNTSANSANLFPATGQQVNGAGANTAFALAAGKSAAFLCGAAGDWRANLSASLKQTYMDNIA